MGHSNWTWRTGRFLTDEELDAKMTDPMERWFFQTFTSWRPVSERDDDDEDLWEGQDPDLK